MISFSSSKLARAAVAAALLGAGAFALAQTSKPAAKAYPLDTCIVSGEKLGGMGDPVVAVYKGQEIKFCCSNCPADFDKDPEKYMKKLEEAMKAPTTKPSAAKPS